MPELYRSSLEYLDQYDPQRASLIRYGTGPKGAGRKDAWSEWWGDITGGSTPDWGSRDRTWGDYGIESPMTRFGQNIASPSQREDTRPMSTSWYDEMAGMGDMPPARSNPPPPPPGGAFAGGSMGGSPPPPMGGMGDSLFGGGGSSFGGGGGSTGGSGGYASLGIGDSEASRSIGQVKAFMDIAREHAPDLAKMAESMRDVSRLTKEQISNYDQYRNILSPFGQMSQTFGKMAGAGDASFAPGSPEARLAPHVSSAQNVIAQLSGSIQGFAEGMAQLDVGAPFTAGRARAGNRWSILGATGQGAAQERATAFDEGLYDYGPSIGGANLGRGAAGLAGGAARAAQSLVNPFSLYHIRLLESMFVGPQFEAARGYQQFQSELGQLGFQSGQMSYGDLMSGQYGQTAQLQSRQQMAQLNLGQQASAAWSPLMNSLVSPEGMQGIGGLGLTIGAPALGVGLGAYRILEAAGARNSGNLAGVLGGAVAAAGLINYGISNQQNYMGQGQFAMAGPLGELSNPAGAAGYYTNMAQFGASWLATGGNVPEDILEQAQQSAASPIFNMATIAAARNQGTPFDAFNRSTFGFNQGRSLRMEGTAASFGFSQAQFSTGYMNQWVNDVATQLAITPEAAAGMYGTLTRNFGRSDQGGNLIPPSYEQASQYNQLSLAGANVEQLPGVIAAALGVNPMDRAAMGQQVMPAMLGMAGTSPEAISRDSWAYGQLAQINPMRRQAGMGEWGTGMISPYFTQPGAADFVTSQYTPWAAGRAMQMPGWSDQGAYGASAYNAGITGNYGRAANIMNAPFTMPQDLAAGRALGNVVGDGGAWQQGIEGATLMQAAQRNYGAVAATSQLLGMSSVTPGLGLLQQAQVGGNVAALGAMGIDPMRAIQAEMGSMGQPNTLENFAQALNSFTQMLADQGIGAVSTRIAAAPIRGEVNLSRMAAGRSPFSVGNGMNEVFADPVRGPIWAAQDAQANALAISNPDFFQAAQPFYNQMGSMINQGGAQMVQAQRMGGQFAQFAQAAQGYQQYGMSSSTAVSVSVGGAMMSPANAGLAMSAANNNPYALSTLANQGVLPIQFQSIDMQTGMPAFYDNVSRQEYAGIQQSLAGTENEGRLGSYSQLSGGMAGLQAQMRVAAAGAAGAGLYWGNFGRNLTMNAQLGGGTLGPTGEVLGGNNLAGLAGQFASLGLPFNAGNGMGTWQIEDAQRNLSREQQTFGLEQQGRQIGLQGAQLGLQRQQFMERWDLGYERFQYNTNYQRQEMNIGRQQQVQTQQWQSEDMAFNRDVNELQFGWQQEDFDRNIRYARGRERKDLLRNQERSTVMFSVQSGQADRQEERFKETTKWADEEFKRKKQYFEEGVKFQEREMQMQKRHFEESHKLSERQLNEQRAAHERAVAFMREQWKLEDQRRLVDRQMAIAQKEVQDRAAAAAAGAGAAMRKLQEQMDLLQEVMQRNEAKARLMNETGALMVKIIEGMALHTLGWRLELDRLLPALREVFGNIQRGIDNLRPPAAAPGGTHEQGVGGGGYYEGGFVDYARGGSTGVGLPRQVAGIVHRNEFVVPENGSLVVRGDNSVYYFAQMVTLLERIEAKLPADITQNIYTNAPVKSRRATDVVYGNLLT